MPDKSANNVSSMFTKIAKKYDLTNDVLSFGLHRIWSRKAIKRLKSESEEICLDLCTGTGALLPLLCKKFEKVVGIDFSPGMLSVAKERFGSKYPNLKLELGDALNLNFPDDSFSVITVAYGVRNFSDLEAGLKEINRVLKPGGQLLIIEFGRPIKILQPFYDFYSKYLMPKIGGMLTGDSAPYKYLPETAKSFPYAEDFQMKLEKTGYSDLSYQEYSLGITYAYFASIKDPQ